MARHRPFCTLNRFKLLQVDQGSSVPLAKCSFEMIPLSGYSVDRSLRAFHSSTHNLLNRVLDTLSYRFLPVFRTVDTSNGWNSQVFPRSIGGINICHKMRHSLSLPTVTHICMGELPHFHHCPTTSFLHSQPIQTPPRGPGLICAADQVFIWDDPSVTPLS